MTSSTGHDRFEELDAGRVLGDLSPEEVSEWEELSRSLGTRPDHGLDLAAGAVASTFAGEDTDLPAGLAERLREGVMAGRTETPAPESPAPDTIVRPGIWNRLAGGQAGWAVAALLAILLVATVLTRPGDSAPSSAEEARRQLVETGSDLFSKDFTGVGDYGDIAGDVVWSDERQEGYMLLSNLPANDPTAKQYQLWIVDPERDEAPVDGGVFDIPAGKGSVVVPIDAKLAVADPQAFVITLEQPGGVVKSNQEIVVALAKL